MATPRLDELKKSHDALNQLREEKWAIEKELYLLTYQFPDQFRSIKKMDFEEIIKIFSTIFENHFFGHKTPLPARGEIFKSEFYALKEKYNKLLKKIEAKTKSFDNRNEKIRDEKTNKTLMEIRNEISFIEENSDQKIETISTLSEKLSLKIIILILHEIQSIHHNQFIENDKKIFIQQQIHWRLNERNDLIKTLSKKIEELIKSDHELIEKTFNQAKNLFLNHLHESYFKTYIFNDYYFKRSIETYEFIDDVQMGSLSARLSFGTKNPQVILNLLRVISFAANEITITPELYEKFEELSSYLQGLWKSTFRQIPDFLKTENDDQIEISPLANDYIRDADDRSLNSHKFPLTKTKLAHEHILHYETINHHLEIFKLAQKTKNEAALIKQPPAVKNNLEINLTDDMTTSLRDQVEKDTPLFIADQTIRPQSPPMTTPLSRFSLLNEFNNEKETKSEENLFLTFSMISQVKAATDPNQKYSLLRAYLDKYALTTVQNLLIRRKKGAFLAQLDDYLEESPLPHFIPFSDTHAISSVHDAIVKNSAASTDGHFYLTQLCELQRQLRNNHLLQSGNFLSLLTEHLDELTECLYQDLATQLDPTEYAKLNAQTSMHFT